MPKKGKTKMSRKAIPENFELSDDEPTMIKLNEEQKLTSKNILFDCPVCKCKLQLRNEIAINPKGITCRCNPCLDDDKRGYLTARIIKGVRLVHADVLLLPVLAITVVKAQQYQTALHLCFK